MLQCDGCTLIGCGAMVQTVYAVLICTFHLSNINFFLPFSFLLISSLCPAGSFTKQCAILHQVRIKMSVSQSHIISVVMSPTCVYHYQIFAAFNFFF